MLDHLLLLALLRACFILGTTNSGKRECQLQVALPTLQKESPTTYATQIECSTHATLSCTLVTNTSSDFGLPSLDTFRLFYDDNSPHPHTVRSRRNWVLVVSCACAASPLSDGGLSEILIAPFGTSSCIERAVSARGSVENHFSARRPTLSRIERERFSANTIPLLSRESRV